MSLHIHSALQESEAMTKLVGHKVLMKLDNTQPSGSFKIRGIGHLAQKAKARGCTRLVSSSGGNAGMAAAYAGRHLGMKTTVIVPSTTSAMMQERIRLLGAEVLVHGEVWDDADSLARQMATSDDCQYVSPFNDSTIWEGHASLVDELKADLNDKKPSAVIVSVGGGGLLCGVVEGLKRVNWGDVPVIAMETEGADCLHRAVKAGKLVTLDGITSIAKSLGAKTAAQGALDACSHHNVKCKVISDKSAFTAMYKFADDHRYLVEPACGASLAALYEPNLLRNLDQSIVAQDAGPIVVVVCGGSAVTLSMMDTWKNMFGVNN